MADYFLDTSALVKRHVKEAGSDRVRTLTGPRSGHTLYVARITAVEVFSAVSRRQRSGHLSAASAQAILGHFHRHMTRRYHVLELTPFLVEVAAKLARRRGLRAYDAVQLAIASNLNSLSRQAGFGPVTFLCSDRELNAAAVAQGMTVEDPADAG